MCMALNLPPFYHCEQGTKASGLAALLIMLHRLAYPDHWRDLVWLFGRVEPELSAIFNGNGWHKRFKHLLESLELIWLNPEQLIIAIHKKGEALYNCWDFMDGTVRPIARPTENQWIMFSSKRVHCIKFKFRYVVYFVYVRYMSLKCSKCFLPTCSLVTRNGLVPHMCGSLEGRLHDAFMLGALKLWRFQQPNGQPYVIYGDPAYRVSRHILAPFRGAQLIREQQDFNKSMSQVRISIDGHLERYVNIILTLTSSANEKCSHSVMPAGWFLSPVACMWMLHSTSTVGQP